MSDVATPDNTPAATQPQNQAAPQPQNPPAGQATTESWADLIMHELGLLNDDLDRVGDKVTQLAGVAQEVDATLVRVDEESERVEAPTETVVATDAANHVGKLINDLVGDVGQHCRTTKLLTMTGQQAMRPALDIQDRQRSIGAGPKLLATAGKS